MKIILSYSTKTVEWPIVEVPLPETTVDNVKKVKTLDNSLTTYVVGARKRTWEHTWNYPTKEEFNEIKGFYDRQIQNQEPVKLTIEGMENVANVPVYMEIGKREVVSFDGMVKQAEVSFTEI